MSLDFNLSKIPKELKTDPLKPSEMHPVLYWLIWATIPMGIGSITEKNHLKVFERLTVWQRMVGPAISFHKGDKVYITLADIRAYIGLSTNVSTETDAVFYRKVARWASQDYRIMEHDNPDEVSAIDYFKKRAEVKA